MGEAMLTPEEIAQRFQLPGAVTAIRPFGSGHINRTFLAETDAAQDVILQAISTDAFHQPEELMRNIAGVTAHLRAKISARGGDPLRETLTVLTAKDGDACVRTPDGACWRAYLRITGTQSFDLPENEAVFREAGRAFGRFQTDLADYPADTLYETIPRFHDTPDRVRRLLAAIEKDSAGRAAGSVTEIRFAKQRADRAARLVRMQREGKLPLRVTHNDTKLNNVLMDAASGKALCVIDLDTVMPGLTAYDFGDAVRFGANTAEEDEKDLSKIAFSMPMYRAWTEGFLEMTANALTPAELGSLPEGCWMMTYEVGIRFLTDWLEGDHYFHTAYPEHNLVRARNQFALLADMEKHETEMLDCVRACVPGVEIDGDCRAFS